MDWKVKYQNASGQKEAFDIVQKAITPEYISKWKVKAEIVCEPENWLIWAKGKGFRETHLDINLDVSFLLKPLSGKISNSINEELEKVI